MPSTLRHGVFITFEGGEGAGKTTLIEEIARQIASEGYHVIKTREPGGTHLGEHIRSLLLKHVAQSVSPYAELCLFLASRAQHIQEIIGPSLEARKIVLCDRFNDSTIAYQGIARGLGFAKVTELCEFICQGLQPHLTLYLDIDPVIGLTRARRWNHHDRIEAEGIAFHTKIREAFRAIHEKNSRRFHLLDASQPPAVVYAEAMKWIQPFVLDLYRM